MSPFWGASWNDWDCEVVKGVPIKCPCEKSSPVYMKMRGLCEDSNIDKYWVPGNKNHEIFYIGFKSSRIVYDKEDEKWKFYADENLTMTTGSTESSFHSFILGKSNWMVEKDSNKRFFLSIF